MEIIYRRRRPASRLERLLARLVWAPRWPIRPRIRRPRAQRRSGVQAGLKCDSSAAQAAATSSDPAPLDPQELDVTLGPEHSPRGLKAPPTAKNPYCNR